MFCQSFHNYGYRKECILIQQTTENLAIKTVVKKTKELKNEELKVKNIFSLYILGFS
jgi:hypothetical protein